MKYLNKVFRYFIYILPLMLFFSYYPIITLGANESMNFELSLPLIWLVIFDLLALIMIIKRGKVFSELKGKWAYLLFPAFLTLSVTWSFNPVRGFLTVGILWLIYFAVFSIYVFRELLIKDGFREKFLKTFIVSTLVICFWCLIQCVLDLIGVSREYTLLCLGCTYRSFGFPHPNGLAIEPQFMGNLLLAPTLTTAYLFIRDDYNNTFRGRVARARRHGARALILGRNLRKPLKVLLLIVLISSLFLTFSRGAIYAFVVAMGFMTTFLITREKKKKEIVKKMGVLWGVIVISFLFTLNLQGIFAQVSKTDDTYRTGVAKVLNHLSLGIIDIRGESEPVEKPVENFVENTVENSEDDSDKAYFDGYVADSTNIRIGLTNEAIKIWSKDFKTMMLGVGLGGAGRALSNNGFSSSKEIIQNQYASLLLETGMVGVLLLGLSFVLVFKAIKNSTVCPMILTMIFAYGISLCFFAGLPNALHIYLLPGLFKELYERN